MRRYSVTYSPLYNLPLVIPIVRLMAENMLGNGNALLMFMSVHNWIFEESWFCLCTDAARNTRSSKGVSKIFWISGLLQSCLDFGVAVWEAWVARVRPRRNDAPRGEDAIRSIMEGKMRDNGRYWVTRMKKIVDLCPSATSANKWGEVRGVWVVDEEIQSAPNHWGEIENGPFRLD